MKILMLSLTNHEDIIEEPGISSIAGYLNACGHEVRVLQVNENNDCMEEIFAFAPRLIGVSTYDMLFQRQTAFSKKVKELLPEALIVLGGYTVSYHAVPILETYDFIDFVIRGEGELAFRQLADAIDKGEGFAQIGNLVYRHNGQVLENPQSSYIEDLNTLPFSDRSYVSRYDLDMVQLATSRGCTSSCTFCCSNDFWRCQNGKRIYRRMTAKRVVDEVEFIYVNYKKTNYTFNDNSFEDPNNDLSRQVEIASQIIERRMEISYNINYRTNFYKYVTDEFMALMLKSGLSSIFIGIDAGNEEDLKLYNKRCTLAECNESLDLFSRYKDVSVRLGFITLNPYTTPERLSANIDFLERNGYAYDIVLFSHKFKPYKGTQLFSKIEKDGLLIGNIFDGGYDYHYTDSRILDFERHIAKQVLRIDNDIVGLRYVCDVYPITLLQLKRQTRTMGNGELISIQQDAYNHYYSVVDMLNPLVAAWMRELVDLMVSGWDEARANAISDAYIDDCHVLDMYRQLRINRNKLYVNMLRKNSYFEAHF